MMKNYLTFNFGESYFRDRPVVDLIIEKMPVSISLGLWLHPHHLSRFHAARHPQGGQATASTSTSGPSAVIIVGYAIPSFILAILLIVLSSPAAAISRWFPLRGLTSDNFESLIARSARSATMPGIWCCR